MSSTRNKNNPGDYRLEQNINNNIDSYSLNNISAIASTNYLAGDGLLTCKNPRTTLCGNYCDVESQLFGIGSTNLVTPKEQVYPELKTIQSLNIINRIPVIIPEPLIVENGQRPYYLN